MSRKPTPPAGSAEQPPVNSADQAGDQTQAIAHDQSQPTAGDNAAPSKPDTQIVGDLIEVRVLLAFGDHEPNDVVEVSEAELEELTKGGHIDADPAAVEYAKSLIA